MSLKLSNPTKQTLVFFYRVWADRPEDRLLRSVTIPSGQQVEIGQQWTRDQQDRIIAQLERHGARDAAEAHHGALGNFIGLLYRVHGEISSEEIYNAHDAVVNTQKRRSVDQAVKSAKGFDYAARSLGKTKALVTGVKVQQIKSPFEPETPDDVSFDMTIDPDVRESAVLNY